MGERGILCRGPGNGMLVSSDQRGEAARLPWAEVSKPGTSESIAPSCCQAEASIFSQVDLFSWAFIDTWEHLPTPR